MKSLLLLTTAVFFLCSCASTPRKNEYANYTNEINWPDGFKPDEVSFFVHNEILIDAPPSKVWEVLINAKNWTNYYKGAKNLRILNNTDGYLKKDSTFVWETMGFEFTSVIKEFEENRRLSWLSEKSTLDGYHAWLLVPTNNGTKTILITDETQNGFLTYLQKIFVPNKLHDLHDIWLSKIKEQAEMLQVSK